MNQAEKVALAMLVTIGATAMDTGLMEEKKKQFEARFGVKITNEIIVSVINKIRASLDRGSEQVVIDG